MSGVYESTYTLVYFRVDSNVEINLQYFASKCNALIFCIKFKQIYILNDSLKIKKIIKNRLQQSDSAIMKNSVSQ